MGMTAWKRPCGVLISISIFRVSGMYPALRTMPSISTKRLWKRCSCIWREVTEIGSGRPGEEIFRDQTPVQLRGLELMMGAKLPERVIPRMVMRSPAATLVWWSDFGFPAKK